MNGETKFNMAMLFYIRINELLKNKDVARISGSVYGWYSCLSAIFDNVFFKLEKKDREDIINLLKRIEKLIYSSCDWDVSNSEFESLKNMKAMRILIEVDRALMIAMDKKNMIFPKITLQGFEQLKNKYGLEVKNG